MLLRLVPVRSVIVLLAVLVLIQAVGVDVYGMIGDVIVDLLPSWKDLL